MKHTLIRHLYALLVAMSLAVPVRLPAADVEPAPAAAGKLRKVASVTRADLRAVVRPIISPDGRFLYAAAWQAGAISLFRRDETSGQLEHLETLQNPADLKGVTGFQVSRDGRLAVAAAFISGTVTLFERNVETGRLRVLQTVHKTDLGVTGLNFAVRADFSPDGRFVYTADGGRGGLTAFRVNGPGLQWLETNQGTNRCLSGTRGLAIAADGKRIYTASYQGHSLAVFDRNGTNGLTTLEQVLRNQEDNLHSLRGAFGVATSRDGKFVYACSGRFGGDEAVSAYAVNADGSLKVLQEFIDGKGDFTGFHGGNSLEVSPNGRHVYAVATVSGSLAHFTRDPKTGRLTVTEIIAGDAADGLLRGAAGVACSPDSRFVYVAAEAASTIVTFEVVQ